MPTLPVRASLSGALYKLLSMGLHQAASLAVAVQALMLFTMPLKCLREVRNLLTSGPGSPSLTPLLGRCSEEACGHVALQDAGYRQTAQPGSPWSGPAQALCAECAWMPSGRGPTRCSSSWTFLPGESSIGPASCGRWTASAGACYVHLRRSALVLTLSYSLLGPVCAPHTIYCATLTPVGSLDCGLQLHAHVLGRPCSDPRRRLGQPSKVTTSHSSTHPSASLTPFNLAPLSAPSFNRHTRFNEPCILIGCSCCCTPVHSQGDADSYCFVC